MRRSLASLLLVPLLACAPPDGDAPDGGVPADPCARSLDDVAGGRELFRFEAGDPFVSVHVERAYVEPGVGHSSIYALESFALAQGEACLETSDEAALEYENSHHNWADSAHAEIDGVRYSLAVRYVFEDRALWRATLTGEDASTGEAVLEERALIPTGGPLACWECPGFLPVWITEVLPDNDGATTDEAGDADPWLELWNPSGDAVSLEGWELELRGAASGTWRFPEGASVGRHQHLVVWLDGEPEEGGLHASFRLPIEGGKLLIRDAEGFTVGERSFSSPGRGRSLDLDIYERRFAAADAPTPGATSSLQE